MLVLRVLPFFQRLVASYSGWLQFPCIKLSHLINRSAFCFSLDYSLCFYFQVETSLFHVDSSHDLSVTFQLRGFKPSIMKFPRAETFSAMTKFSGMRFSVSEVIKFDPELLDGIYNCYCVANLSCCMLIICLKVNRHFKNWSRFFIYYRGKGNGCIFWSS